MASQIQDLLVQHDIQIGSAACDAAAIGNLEALRQILQGHDCPDVEFLADSEGRTPLVSSSCFMLQEVCDCRFCIGCAWRERPKRRPSEVGRPGK
jgi:hypothetical protein